MSYTTKIYKVPGGNEMVVESGGKITLKSGATLENGGDFFTSVTFNTDHFAVNDGEVSLKEVTTFDTDYFEVSEGEVTLKTEVVALLGLLSSLPITDPQVAGQIWNDGGVLKVSAGG